MANKPTSELERGGYCVDQMPDMAALIKAGNELEQAANRFAFARTAKDYYDNQEQTLQACAKWRAALVPPEKDAGK